MKLQNTLKSLILEVSSMETIIDCIKKKRVCMISYDGDLPGGTGLREIEPVALGYTKKGNMVLRAWETGGASHRDTLGIKPIPGWRFFLINKIFNVKPLTKNFTEPRPNFNPNGDKSMTSVIIMANF